MLRDSFRPFRPFACRVLFVAACLLMLPVRSQAAPLCGNNTLAGYLVLGSCSIDSLTFSNFGLVAPLPTGASLIPLNQITVTPFSTPSGVGFQFGFQVDANTFDLSEILFGYQVSGAFLTGARLDLSGASATDDGVVTAVQDVCISGTFSPGSLLGCPGSQSNVAFAIDGDQLLNASLLFPPTFLLGIVNDIAVDGGTGGSASLRGNVTNTFAAAVPEPTSLVLVGSGILLLLRRRRGLTNRSIRSL